LNRLKFTWILDNYDGNPSTDVKMALSDGYGTTMDMIRSVFDLQSAVDTAAEDEKGLISSLIDDLNDEVKANVGAEGLKAKLDLKGKKV
jgi:hypothetical protein